MISYVLHIVQRDQMHRASISIPLLSFRRNHVLTRSASIKVYGHYGSQPARSVLWLLTMHNAPFEMVKVDPIKGEARKPEYKNIFPLALVPGIIDDDFVLSEGSAILQYLCEKNGWIDWWPCESGAAAIKRRAKINMYLSSHHSIIRPISGDIVRPLLMEKVYQKPWDTAQRAKASESVLKRIQKFENSFLNLSGNGYIGGFDKPSIADLMAYTEIAQISQLKLGVDMSSAVNTNLWLERMQRIPGHDDVHRIMPKLAEFLQTK
jgi:glutathione S-transferase